LVPALARAESAGIVVINIDNRLEPEILAEYDLQIPFIGPSNLAGAKMVGDFALEGLASDSEVAILEGITSAFNSIQRRTGFEQAVAEAGMEVVTLQSAEWDQTRAAQVTAAILSQFPELDVILAANDNMALGAASAVGVAALGREITIAGFDNISAIQPLIKSGTVIATVDQFGDQLAVFGIEYALEVLATGIVPEDRETSLELITADSL
jgi:ribose transport system substrate-binding protein